MEINHDPKTISAIFETHGFEDPWTTLQATGIANQIYATSSVVLRVATDHADAIPDARTESVAAPVVHAAGIQTPRLLAFDDSRKLVDRPYSIWERVHGETVGMVDIFLSDDQFAKLWRQIGQEIFQLHERVKACPDPNEYLDKPRREFDLDQLLTKLNDAGYLDRSTAKAAELLIDKLAAHVDVEVENRFLHNDLHIMNMMCSPEGELLALIDWGDAGWGDPTLDFMHIPLEALPHAWEGYQLEGTAALGDFPEARFIWDKLRMDLLEASMHSFTTLPIDLYNQYLQTHAK